MPGSPDIQPRPGQVCEGCRHFVPDKINPPAGMGSCRIGKGRWHPRAPHHCKQRDPA